MILCLVTDRRRLGAAMGARPDDWLDLLREQVTAAVSAGIDLIQVREPDLEAAPAGQLDSRSDGASRWDSAHGCW